MFVYGLRTCGQFCLVLGLHVWWFLLVSWLILVVGLVVCRLFRCGFGVISCLRTLCVFGSDLLWFA